MATAQVVPTREQVTRPVEPTRQQRRPQLEVEGGIERAPCALEGPGYENIRLTLRAVEFEGLRGLTATDLTPAYAAYVGREVPISVVCEIRDRAATILRDAGYIAAVQVPEQRIDDGVVRFRVLMAHLTQVRVRGDATGAERAIAGYLDQLTEAAGVQPLRCRALSAARERPARLHGPPDASPCRQRPRRRHRRRHRPAHAGLCRLQRPERRVARSSAAGAGCCAARCSA